MIAATATTEGERVTSTSSFLLRLALAGLVGLGATSLTGCGRKGEPVVPSLEPKPQTPRPVGIPVSPTAKKPEKKKENKSFLLDPLL